MKPADIPPPTAEDLARDLVADLELCQRATKGPHRIESLYDDQDTPFGLLDAGNFAVVITGDGDGCAHGVQEREDAELFAQAQVGWAAAIRRAVAAEDEVKRLQAVIDAHDLCHNLHGQVDARAFADGCAAEQRKIYGCAPDADEVERLQVRLAELEAASHAHD